MEAMIRDINNNINVIYLCNDAHYFIQLDENHINLFSENQLNLKP